MAIAHVAYHFESDSWWIDSPEYPGYTAIASTRGEATELARAGLPFFADDPDLEVLGLDAPQAVTVAQAVEAVRTFVVTGLPLQGFSWSSEAPRTGSPPKIAAPN